jgi:hypothetical protein
MEFTEKSKMKKSQSYRGVIAVGVAGVMMWSAYGFAWQQGYLDRYRPAHLGACVVLTAINPGCWSGYAAEMGAFSSLRNLATPWKSDALSQLGGPKSFTWKPELKCGRESYEINCPPISE